MVYDVVIVGAGPAGMSAAIYAGRAGLRAVMVESNYMPGGQMITTSEIDNYPGVPSIDGFQLAQNLSGHAAASGVETIEDRVTGIRRAGELWELTGEEQSYQARAVILATGCRHRQLGIPGEQEMQGRGVSYCAVCDGAFYRQKVTAVAGGGDSAVGEALYLSGICEKVYLIHRRDQLRAAAALQEKLREKPNVEILWNSQIREIRGEGNVKSLVVYDKEAEKEREIEADGLFVAIGTVPNSEAFRDVVACDEAGYVICSEEGVTGTPGIFAAGDVRVKKLRQIVTAAADGANALIAAEEYLHRQK